MNQTIEHRIKQLATLGERLKSDSNLEPVRAKAHEHNPWFVEQFVSYSLTSICTYYLDESKLNDWIRMYPPTSSISRKTIGIIPAGNLPLVGFHDLLCAYVLGFKMAIKLSSKDDILTRFVLDELRSIDPELKHRLSLVERLENFDAIIATGSNNSHRYFEYYFRNYPKILRKTRNGIAILTGNETDQDLQLLADDICLYFGFGCRNVSKIYAPAGFDITKVLANTDSYKWMHQHTKYMNNYDYQRTLLMLNRVPHLASDYLILNQNPSIHSPIATVHYEFYDSINRLEETLNTTADSIQCIVSSESFNSLETIPLGTSQQPRLSNYADGIDTILFLKGIV